MKKDIVMNKEVKLKVNPFEHETAEWFVNNGIKNIEKAEQSNLSPEELKMTKEVAYTMMITNVVGNGLMMLMDNLPPKYHNQLLEMALNFQFYEDNDQNGFPINQYLYDLCHEKEIENA